SPHGRAADHPHVRTRNLYARFVATTHGDLPTGKYQCTVVHRSADVAVAEWAQKGQGAVSFSLELSDDVIQVRDWVHEFAATVVRPAAAEWDEREETPWPIIGEAARIGLYSVDLFAAQAAEPTGIGMLTVFEELFWGDA